MLSREDKQALCICGHKRAEHCGKDRAEDCAGCDSNWQFCRCRSFREAQFNSNEEIEMAKKNSTKKSARAKRERGAGRIQLVYTFDAERAKTLRSAEYKDKENMIASALNALIGGRKDGHTKPEMVELLKAEMGSKYTSGFPLKKMKAEKVLKASKEKRNAEGVSTSAAPVKREKKARKARKSKSANGAEKTANGGNGGNGRGEAREEAGF